MQPEAVLAPRTTSRPHETMDKMDKGFTTSSVPMYNQKIQSVTLHVFADASSKGVCAAVDAVVDQLQGKNQGLLISNSRISKKNLTIPRLELIAACMLINLQYPIMDGQTSVILVAR